MRFTRAGSLVAVAMLAASALLAQTTGRIEGRVADASGSALPGVSVVAVGPSLPGEARTVSDVDGSFRLVNLPPGVYTVTISIDGFNTVEQRDVKVGIDRTVSLETTLSAQFAEQVTVLGDAPVVDTTKATTGVSVSAETFERLPIARDFYAVAQIASGSARDGAGTTFYGSTGAENQYVIEGLNTTGGRYGDRGQDAQLRLHPGGRGQDRRPAGRVRPAHRRPHQRHHQVGLQFDFEGSVFGFYQGGDLQADNTTGPATPDTQATIQDIDGQYDYGFTLGGAFVEDKLWYFAAYNRQNRTDQTSVIREHRDEPVLGFSNSAAGRRRFSTTTSRPTSIPAS